MYILVSVILIAEDIVDIQDVVAILVIEAVILEAFARFRKDPPWVPRRLIFEGRIANTVCRWQVSRQRLERLCNSWLFRSMGKGLRSSSR